MIVNRSTKCPWTKPLADILDADPVDWEDFTRAHRSEPKNLSALIQHLSFSEVLNHFPPPNVVHELLAAHHDEIVRSPTALIKQTLLSACATSCLEVVELIAKDASYILQLEIDLTGDLPLHRAKSLEAAIILVQAYPQGVGRKNREGNLPLHVAIIEHRHEDLIMMLVKKGLEQCIGGVLGCGGILVQNKDGETPLSLLYSQCRMGPITVPLYGVDVRLWETLKYFMKVYDLQRHNIVDSCQLDKDYMDDESRLKTPLIHHLLSLDAPENVIELCLTAGSTSLDDIDDLGRVAFSRIAGNKGYSEEFILSCLQTYPHAASREDRRRRLPLHWAAESGRQAKDGLMDIINAFPNALSMSDADGMYPCMLAALSSDCTLDLIYTLLREVPDVLK
jgi:hypothetical protein